MQHGKDGGRADAGAQEDDGSVAWPQREAAAWRTRVEHIANPDLSVDISAGRAVSFSLDAHAIAIVTWLARQRIAAQQSGRVGRWP
jgi:hypothetical protein